MNSDRCHSRQEPGRGTRGFLTRMIRKRSSLALVTIPLLAIALAAMLLPRGISDAASAPTGSNWNPASILQVLEQGTGQVVVAHRGVYGPGCPENSLCSIQQTYQDGIEAIELDVKQSQEGTPWLFHEQNVGRVIAHSPSFNSFQNADPPVGWDPAVSTLTDAELGSSFLLDANGATTSYHPLSLASAFAAIKNTGWDHMVIVLDLKTLNAVSQAADLAIQYGLQDSVVLKFSVSLLAASNTAYSNVTDYTKGLAFAPTIYAPDMANIMRDGWSYTYCKGMSTLSMAQCTVDSFIRNLQKTAGYAWLEVGNKQPVASDPTDFLLHSNLGAIGGFQPVPEYPSKTGPGQSYVRSNGTCCASLSDYLTPANQWFPAETMDARESISNLIGSGMTSVITDDPLTAIKAMTQRNTSLYGPATPLQAQFTGTWVGTYNCHQGLTGLRLDLLAERTTATAIFNFYPVQGNPSVSSGAFTMTGSYSASGIQLSPGAWIDQPSGYHLVGLDGGPLTSNGTTMSGTVVDYAGCTTFTLTKAS